MKYDITKDDEFLSAEDEFERAVLNSLGQVEEVEDVYPTFGAIITTLITDIVHRVYSNDDLKADVTDSEVAFLRHFFDDLTKKGNVIINEIKR